MAAAARAAGLVAVGEAREAANVGGPTKRVVKVIAMSSRVMRVPSLLTICEEIYASGSAQRVSSRAP